MKEKDITVPTDLPRDAFPSQLEISFVEGGQRQTLQYEKVTWPVEGGRSGLRYGENVDRPAALYRLINGNLVIGEVELVAPHPHLTSAAVLLQQGKHPSKTGLRDADIALAVFRQTLEKPTCVIVKHNNPCGAAIRSSVEEAFWSAFLANRVGTRGGCAAFNRSVNRATAEAILHASLDVVVAPDFEPGAVEQLAANPRLCLLRVGGIDRLTQWVGRPYLEFASLQDGGVVAQWAVTPQPLTRDDCRPAQAVAHNAEVRSQRQPTGEEWENLLFAWKLAEVTVSDSIVYVKDGTTVAVGVGGQDRTAVAQTTRDKAYHAMADRLAWERFKRPFTTLSDPEMRRSVWDDTVELRGGLIGASMASDGAIFDTGPVEVSIAEGIRTIMQPGGAPADAENTQLCNEAHVAMVFTGIRVFRH
ncbi:MAG: hypothetical protein P9L99_06580 [Candidatus Lernaella stagnicola]|nr:hypothetical protein [Candidatus Lernaella stagnicola]